VNYLIERVQLTPELKKELHEKKLFSSENSSLNLQIITGTLNNFLGMKVPQYVHTAKFNGELVGWSYLVDSHFHRNLISTFVDSRYRLKGIGRQLVIHASHDSKSNYIHTCGASEFYTKVKGHTEKRINVLI
jgi:GNAT superfamily N-acetyltransferase